MVELSRVNNQIEQHLATIDTTTGTMNQRECSEFSSVENSIQTASDLVRYEYKKHQSKFDKVYFFFVFLNLYFYINISAFRWWNWKYHYSSHCYFARNIQIRKLSRAIFNWIPFLGFQHFFWEMCHNYPNLYICEQLKKVN